jgi:hypothetical protein
MSRLRFASAGVALVAAALLVSCTGAPARVPVGGQRTPASARPWWPQGAASITPCGAAALVRANDHVRGVGTCQGQLEIPALKVTLTVGQRIDVHMTEFGAVASGDQKVAAYALPRSSRPSVLMPGAIGPGPATRTYQAIHPGQAVLLDRTDGCWVLHHLRGREVSRTCPVAVVTVVP